MSIEHEIFKEIAQEVANIESAYKGMFGNAPVWDSSKWVASSARVFDQIIGGYVREYTCEGVSAGVITNDTDTEIVQVEVSTGS